MASNQLPSKVDRLFFIGEQMCTAAGEFEVEIDLKQNTEPVVRPILTAAIAAQLAFENSETARKAANALQKAADNAVKVIIANARRRLAGFFGENYSASWLGAGWPNGSTAVPKTMAERYTLLSGLISHLTQNPAHASVDLGVTVALVTAAQTALGNARTAYNNSVTAKGEAKAARDTAVANLRTRLKGMITELETLLADDDPRWHSFGLSRPADEETPEAPSIMTLLSLSPGSLFGDWDDALRADRYRVWIFIVGVDTAFRPVETVYDSDCTLEDLPTGATVKAYITSVNAAGESEPGPEGETVVA